MGGRLPIARRARGGSPTAEPTSTEVTLEPPATAQPPPGPAATESATPGAEPNAEEKDEVELAVHKLICSDPFHAADYAARLAADWTQFRRTARSLVDTGPKETEP